MIYLPGLGSTEINGEEGRRILPAITMLDTGKWLVPYVGGKPFLRKPPLVNWAIAASFKLTGVRNEWTARLPSALCVLMLAVTIVALSSGRGWINAQTGLTAAIFALTEFGLLSKARFAGAEIEGIYVPLYGMGMVCWIAWWSQRRSPWLTWTIPFLFLGLAALAKAPLHLLFFYAIVVAVLWRQHALRQLFSAPHLIGVLMMIGVFAAWAVPYFQTAEAVNAAKVWKDQFAGRVIANAFSWKSYLLNMPRALMDLLPWLLFAPLLFRYRRNEPRELAQKEKRLADEIQLPMLWACVACFGILLLIPGVLPRYVLPLAIPFCLLTAVRIHEEDDRSRALVVWYWVNRAFAAVLLGLAIAAPFVVSASEHEAVAVGSSHSPDLSLAIKATFIMAGVVAACVLIISRRRAGVTSLTLVITTGILFGLGAILYATAAVPWMIRADNVRPVAAAIDSAVQASDGENHRGGREGPARLVLFDPGWEPAIFYLQTKYKYAAKVTDIPRDAEFVLARAEDEKERGEQLARFARRRPDLELVRTIRVRAGQELLLLRRRESISKDARP